MPLDLEIRRLSQRDLCGGFSAGPTPDDARLDEFLQRYAKQSERRQTSATSLAWAATAIAGFVTVVPGTVDPVRIAEHVKGLSRHAVPVLVLARMATDARFQKQGVGDCLLRDVVFAKARELADGFGCVGVWVDAKPGAVVFYERYGFVALGPDVAATEPRPMFLALGTIRAGAPRAAST
jgi:GNAT superfamily N-acetyltransferase